MNFRSSRYIAARGLLLLKKDLYETPQHKPKKNWTCAWKRSYKKEKTAHELVEGTNFIFHICPKYFKLIVESLALLFRAKEYFQELETF